MKSFMAFLICGVTLSYQFSWSDSTHSILKTPDQKKWTLVLKDSIKVSPGCLKAACIALKKVAPVEKKPTNESELTGHPAANFCEQHDGKYLVGQDEKGNEDGLCIFKDESYILGWDYLKLNGVKKARP